MNDKYLEICSIISKQKRKESEIWQKLFSKYRDRIGIDISQYRNKTLINSESVISNDLFAIIVNRNKKDIKRIKSISVNNGLINGTAISQSGLTIFSFIIDFNDWGFITGHYWILSNENEESNIPRAFANNVAHDIFEVYENNDINPYCIDCFIKDCSFIQQSETIKSLSNYNRKRISLFKRKATVFNNYDSELFIGLNYILVLCLLIRIGVSKIKCIAIENKHNNNEFKEYEVISVRTKDGIPLKKEEFISNDVVIYIDYYVNERKIEMRETWIYRKIFSKMDEEEIAIKICMFFMFLVFLTMCIIEVSLAFK